MTHIVQPDGIVKTVEVPGPPDCDAWYSSWRIFENTLLGITVQDASKSKAIPIVTQSALDVYSDMFRDLVKAYPECWHLCVIAEDRCRAEHFTRLSRRALNEFTAGLCPGYNPVAPWDHIFRRAALDRDYWASLSANKP